MTAYGALDERWRLLDPHGAIVARLPRPFRSSLGAAAELRGLPPGTRVVVEADGVAAALRCAWFARRAHLVVDQRFVALPSLGHEAVRVEDSPEARACFSAALLTVPPGAGWATPLLDVVVAVGRIVARTRLLGLLAPGRVLVARVDRAIGAAP